LSRPSRASVKGARRARIFAIRAPSPGLPIHPPFHCCWSPVFRDAITPAINCEACFLITGDCLQDRQRAPELGTLWEDAAPAPSVRYLPRQVHRQNRTQRALWARGDSRKGYVKRRICLRPQARVFHQHNKWTKAGETGHSATAFSHIGDHAMDTVDYAAVGFLIACMTWAAAMTLKPADVKPRAQGSEKRRAKS
jgi:hypothetical protein